MKLGSENRKAVWFLVVLGGVALYGVYNAFFAGPSIPSSSSAPAATARPADTSSALSAAAEAAAAQSKSTRRPPVARTEEFKPALVARNIEDRPDVTKIDPTLRLDLLAKLEKVPAPAGTHNLFQVGPAPVKAAVEMLPGPEPKLNLWARFPPPLPTPTPPPGPPPPPKPVPINVKYYGWAEPSGSGRRRAFFLDGDDVIIKAEGESIKGHYRVVRIDATRVVVEDTNDKLQQTLTKVEAAP